MQRVALLTWPVLVLLAGCGPGGVDKVTTIVLDDWVEGSGPRGQVIVTAPVMWGPSLEAGPGEVLPPADAYICGTVLDSYPPKCSHPIIPLHDVPGLDELPRTFDDLGVVETVPVELTGTSDGTSIVVESVTVVDQPPD